MKKVLNILSVAPSRVKTPWATLAQLAHVFVLAVLLVASVGFVPALLLTVIAQTGDRKDSASKSQNSPPEAHRAKITNPLNELLEEAQRDIDKKDFAAAIDPLQKFIAEQPDVAYGHFQLGYVFTALHKNAEARIQYERAQAIIALLSKSGGRVLAFSHGHTLRAVGAAWIRADLSVATGLMLDVATLSVLRDDGHRLITLWNGS